MAGLKYTFIAGMNRSAQDLREAAHDLDNLGEWLRRELYPYFGKTWWKQNRPYRFQVWTEYDWLLPPLLTLDYLPDEEIPPTAAVLRDPLRRSRVNKLEYGDPVVIENFTVQRVYHDKNMIQVSVGKGSEAARRAYKINVRGLNLGAGRLLSRRSDRADWRAGLGNARGGADRRRRRRSSRIST